MVAVIVVILTIIFALVSVSPLFETDDVWDADVVGQ